MTPPILLPAVLLAREPHLPAFWPGRRVLAADGPAPAPLGFAHGPWRPPRLGGREPPVALVIAEGAADPIAAALAGPEAPEDGVRAAMSRLAEARLGGPPGLPDPGPAALGCGPGEAVILLGGAAPIPGEARPQRRAADPFVAPEGALDPWTLLDAAAEIRGASRDLALLALAAGVPVADGPLAGADPVATYARIIAATRCADPFRRQPCTLPEALDILALWRREEAASRRVVACLGIQSWKRERLTEALASAAPPPAFPRTARAALDMAGRKGGTLLAWSSAAPPGLREDAAGRGVDLLWLEDGFIRSAGLGAQFRPGGSFVLDPLGPHYDPGRPSALEALLQGADFPPALLDRAAALRRAVLARGVTKYNLRGPAPDLRLPPGRRVVLVPGQVEDDASVRLGGGAIRTNLELLRRVRAAEPDAILVYKPHPDLEAGFRRGRIPRAELDRLADRVAPGAPMAALLARVDAVHVLTSLTGFEAILRGIPVTSWGAPFYAGWGLTDHRGPALPRRSRRLTVEELVAAALILYPRYLDPVTRLPCPPELFLDRLGDPALWPLGRRSRLRAAEGAARRFLSRLLGRR